jgi:hypothetical protein
MVIPNTAAIAWGARVSPEFRDRVRQLCNALDWPEHSADWLMACMAFETGRSFSPAVQNPQSSATGLIQFMASTAAGLGTTTAKLAKMDAVTQLGYVEKYFKPYAHRVKSLEDLYMAILWPRAIGKSLSYVLWSKAHPGWLAKAYAVNKGLDLNRDGQVTKAEATRPVRLLLDEGRLKQNAA